MFILHVALQGCLKGRNVAYGLTADTGGHIRYLLELAEACARDPAATRIVLATRLFESQFGVDYARPSERLSDKVEILRLPTITPGYLPKEALHSEVACYAEALIAWIIDQPAPPDLVHAHYADAAAVAVWVRNRLGIPFAFTGHSLGRPKARMLGIAPDSDAAMRKRITNEESALRHAALVVASSRDEAEVQYAAYKGYDPGRIRIVPPGSDLRSFAAAQTSALVDAAIDRFLADPSKPALLALARPVARKNLGALVTAYGECSELQERANLVLVAGTRDDLRTLDGDMADTMRELLVLIDRYDLYGRCAYPKSHRPEDVPAIYAYARDRRGVFINPALNEPFGLTLLEASAVGLPIIATESGGPNDIVEGCGNGVLVDPCRPEAIARAALDILRSPRIWARYAASGAEAARAYDWDRHAARYHSLVRDLLRSKGGETRPRPSQLLVCDIDNTLVGCDASLAAFGRWHADQPELALGVATGRSFHSALAILEERGTPRPMVMVTSVGSEIYHLDVNGVTYTADAEWRRRVAGGWNRDGVRAALEGLEGLVAQAPLEQRTYKLSYLSDGSESCTARVQARLASAGLQGSVIHSHRRYLDVLPRLASKGSAVEYLRSRYGLSPQDVFVAGDSGNDVEMLRALPQAIIVANFTDGLAGLADLSHSYVARRTHALGVMEGVDHFRSLPTARPLVGTAATSVLEGVAEGWDAG